MYDWFYASVKNLTDILNLDDAAGTRHNASMATADSSPGETPESVGEMLRLLRHRARLNRESLAELAAVSTGAVSNYENDVTAPQAATLRRIIRALAAELDRDPEDLWLSVGTLLDAQPVTPPKRRSPIYSDNDDES